MIILEYKGHTLECYDNSSLADWRTKMPRVWYFKHIRKWVRDYSTGRGAQYRIPATVMGNAWHAMMDDYWSHPEDGWEPAWEVFRRYWEDHQLAGGFPIDELDPEFKSELKSYSPDVIQAAIIAYDSKRRKFISQIELLSTEQPFIVPIDPEDPTLWFIGRKDKRFISKEGRQSIVDHKTTSTYNVRPLGYPHLKPSWKDGWDVDMQPRGYIYAEKREYGYKRVWCLIDGVLFHPEKYDSCLLPIECQTAGLDQWLQFTHDTIADIKAHRTELERLRSSGRAQEDEWLRPFPCFGCKMGCEYQELCRARFNPERWDEPPEGYVESHWAPFDHQQVLDALSREEK